MEKNEIYRVIIEDMSEEGLGIGHAEGMVVFVKDTVVGDTADIRIVKVKKSYAFGRVEEIIVPSADRVSPECPVASRCGGCTLQHISYEKELEIKRNRVISSLERIGEIDHAEKYLEDIIGMDDPVRYRNKMQFPVGRRGGDTVSGGRKDNFDAFSCRTTTVLGFYAGRTHSLIPVEDCYIGHRINKYIIAAFTKWADKHRISVYNERTGEGCLRHVVTRVGYRTGELMVCIVASSRRVPELDDLVLMLFQKIHKYNTDNATREEDKIKLKSVVLNINSKNTNRILGDKTVVINGQDYITDYIGDIKFQIGVQSFYQVNPVQTRRIYDKVLEYANLTGNETVWDMYSGIGTISLHLSDHARRVYGVEVVPQAIEDAEKNAEINNISNVEFFVGKAEEIVPDWFNGRIGEYDASTSRLEKGVDVVCVDPPRKGCDEKLLSTIVDMKPRNIIYVSCNPGTLARDLKYLIGNGFKLEKYSIYDQFSRSMHTEVVTLLTRPGL